MFGNTETEIPLQTFIDALEPHGISDLPTWCQRCGNDDSRGCELLASGAASASDYASITSTSGRQHVSPVVAGVIGALVGIVVAGILFAALGLWGNKKGRGSGYVGGKRPERETSYAGDTVSGDITKDCGCKYVLLIATYGTLELRDGRAYRR